MLRQTKLDDFETEVIEQTEQTEYANPDGRPDREERRERIEKDARLFEVPPRKVPRLRYKLEQEGVDIDAARRVESAEGSAMVVDRDEDEQEYLRIRNKLDVLLPANDQKQTSFRAGGSQ